MKSKRIESRRIKSVLIICPFPENSAAGQRLKYEQYLEDWNKRGIKTKVSSFVNDSTWNILYEKGYFFKKIFGFLIGYFRRIRDLFRLRDYDLVYVFMWVTPYFSTFFERIFLLISKKLIFDLEDNLLIKNNLNKRINPNYIATLFKNPNKQIILAKYSDAVITSSPELEQICRELNKKKSSFYITSSVNTDKFIPKRNKNKNEVIVGWTGTFSSKQYISIVEDALQELAKEVDFKLHVIGNFDYYLPNVNLMVSKWSLEKEISQMQTLDIGIYPLPNNEWVYGKSGLKAIQYMSFGIPTVATKIGNTPNIITNREEGILVESSSEWISALKELIKNKSLREEMGKKARKKAIKYFSQKAVSKSYAKVLNLCLDR